MNMLLQLGIESPVLKKWWWALVAFMAMAIIYLLFMPLHYLPLILLAAFVLGLGIGILVAAAAPIWARIETRGETQKT